MIRIILKNASAGYPAAALADNLPMGHSKAAKTASHERIVKLAADMFRERGIDGISVADLMQCAGLTHGGFYRHFDSREDLVVEAVDRALREGGAAVDAIAANPGTGIGALVDAYLSLVHRDKLASSCAVSALAGDVARSGKRARSAYTAQVNRYVRVIGKLIEHVPRKAQRASALAALATLVGAVSMSRAVNDEKLSREILKSAADELKARFGR
jgi:TetR/AcrR family transcriptional regulator, transcriptional repressor for nem operon